MRYRDSLKKRPPESARVHERTSLEMKNTGKIIAASGEWREAVLKASISEIKWENRNTASTANNCSRTPCSMRRSKRTEHVLYNHAASPPLQLCSLSLACASALRNARFSLAASSSVLVCVCLFCASSFFWRSPVEVLFARALSRVLAMISF